jgi:hypothetical protein
VRTILAIKQGDASTHSLAEKPKKLLPHPLWQFQLYRARSKVGAEGEDSSVKHPESAKEQRNSNSHGGDHTFFVRTGPNAAQRHNADMSVLVEGTLRPHTESENHNQ